jgi:hypothetical protein
MFQFGICSPTNQTSHSGFKIEKYNEENEERFVVHRGRRKNPLWRNFSFSVSQSWTAAQSTWSTGETASSVPYFSGPLLGIMRMPKFDISMHFEKSRNGREDDL